LIILKATPSAISPDDFVVSVTYDATKLPIWNLGTFVPLPSKTIVRASVIRRGGLQ
jgi:hypothetical protein